MTVQPTPAGTPPETQRGRPAEYYPALEDIKEGEPGQWWVLATFESVDGAKHSKSRIRSGKTRIPDPAPDSEWDFLVVRFPEDDRSELWVKHE